MKSRMLGALLIVLAVSAPAVAQPAGGPSVALGQAFGVLVTPPAATDTTPAATALRLYLNGAQVGADLPVAVGGADVRFSVPGITTPGLHRLEAAGLNVFSEGPRSALVFCVGPLSGCAPAAPGLPRIQVTTTQVFDQVPRENGGIELRIASTRTEFTELK